MVSMKYEKELLVTGMDGTSSYELLLLLCFLLPINYGCYNSILHIFNLNTTTNNTTNNNIINTTTIKKISIEFISIWIPMIICPSTILYPYGIIVLFVQVLIIVYDRILLLYTKQTSNSNTTTTTTSTIQQSTSFITLLLVVYRSGLLLYTIIAILSVDFPILFPRRFVKTEIYGYSYMDIGASSFVFSSGIVSSYAKGRNFNNFSNTTTSSKNTTTSIQTLQQQLRKWMYKICPLVLMGIIRLLTHKNIEYQEHVSEYGIHWNFFFTLSWLTTIPILRTVVVSIICTLVPSSQKKVTKLIVSLVQQPTWILPICILVCYQVLFLSNIYYNGQEFIINSPRSCTAATNVTTVSMLLCNIIVANREGIFGCISYTGLYLLAEKIAYNCLWYPLVLSNTDSTTTVTTTITILSNNTKSKFNNTNCSILLLQQSILWTIIWLLLTLYFQIPVSRRSTNISFIIWTIVINVGQLTILSYIITIFYFVVKLTTTTTTDIDTATTTVVDDVTSSSTTGANKTITTTTTSFADTPILLNAMNRHGLLIFIISNLLTGIINLSINTVSVTSIVVSFTILIVYVIIIATIATYVIDKVQLLLKNILLSRNQQQKQDVVQSEHTIKDTVILEKRKDR